MTAQHPRQATPTTSGPAKPGQPARIDARPVNLPAWHDSPGRTGKHPARAENALAGSAAPGNSTLYFLRNEASYGGEIIQ